MGPAFAASRRKRSSTRARLLTELGDRRREKTHSKAVVSGVTRWLHRPAWRGVCARSRGKFSAGLGIGIWPAGDRFDNRADFRTAVGVITKTPSLQRRRAVRCATQRDLPVLPIRFAVGIFGGWSGRSLRTSARRGYCGCCMRMINASRAARERKASFVGVSCSRA